MSVRRGDERGTALVIGIMIIVVMMALGLGTFAFVEGQQRASADERVRDSSYNLAESALESAVAYLSVTWPSSTQPWGYKVGQPSGTAGTCGPTSATTDNCPDPSMVTTAFTQSGAHQTDYAGAPNWTTTVRDNGTPSTSFYRESSTGTQPEYDANGDGAVWVRAKATVQGRTRILIGLVKAQPKPLPYPRYALFGGGVYINGAAAGLTQKIVDTQGSASVPGKVGLTCINAMQPAPASGPSMCPGADPTKGQVQPWTVSTAQPYHQCINETIGPGPINQPCLSINEAADMVALRNRAKALGTYYTTCPTAAQLTGKDVFLDNSSGLGCTYSSGTFNSAASPGMIVIAQGLSTPELVFNGTATYYGLIYDADEYQMGTSGAFGDVEINGTAQVVGGAIMDEQNVLGIQSTKSPALIYDPNAWNQLFTTGAIKIVPGTLREVPPGS
jgi:Tfp pilus assembly protein PilX